MLKILEHIYIYIIEKAIMWVKFNNENGVHKVF